MNSISIVMSCYNEENNLKRGVLEQLHQYLSRQSYPWEIVIVNDKSTDSSGQLLLAFAKKHKNVTVFDIPEKGGKPGGIWYGLQQAKNDIVLFTDIDQSTPINQIEKLQPYFDKYDIVIGSRGRIRENFSPVRQIMSAVFFYIRRFAVLPNIIDTQCGFKVFKRQVALKLFPRLNVIKNIQNSLGWRVSAFDVELLFMAEKLGYSIKEVPVDWKNEDTSTSKGDNAERFKRESILMAKEIFRVKLNDLKGVYEK